MRITARVLSVAVFFLLTFFFFKTPAHAQTIATPTPLVAQTSTQSSSSLNNFLTPNVDSNVPQNHHAYTQIVLIDALSAVMCQLTGIDPTDPKQPCLGVDPTTGKIGIGPTNNSQTIGTAQNPQVGGAVGIMSQYISSLYIPAVTSTQYLSYLSSNFGIVKPTYAAAVAGPNGGGTNCDALFGYGFCGLYPIFSLWTGVRDIAYAMLTILFIAIGIGVMLRFKVDPRTVMTLQNQIPRVIIAILLITFSYAIAAVMIDLMWTVTYAGLNFIAKAAPNSTVAISCGPTVTQPISQAAQQRLINQPVSYTDMVFNKNCNGIVHSGIFQVAQDVSTAFGGLVTEVVKDLLGLNLTPACDLNPFNLNLTGCVQQFFVWLTEQIVKLIVIIAILIALFRLWFQLIKCYLTFLIFVILGPLWIVMGLIPGRPLGFEKWLRIVFSNLIVFPLVAFIIVFARVLIDAIPVKADPQNVFIPPLIGNPNVATFTAFLGFGAIMMAPTIPDLIKDRMKATGQGKYGPTIAAGLGFAAGALTSPGRRVWEGLNRRNPQTGQAEGSVAILKQKAWERSPVLGKRAIGKRIQMEDIRLGKKSEYNARDNRTIGETMQDKRRTERQKARQQRQQQGGFFRGRSTRRNPQPPGDEEDTGGGPTT